jgi:hypothetical protein
MTIKAVKGWVADTNNDATHDIADVKTGDKVLIFTKRRFISGDDVSAAFVVDKGQDTDAFRSGTGDWRSGDSDWHHCDGH